MKSLKSSPEKSLRNLNMANYISSYSPSPSPSPGDRKNFINENFEKLEKMTPMKLNFNNYEGNSKTLNKSSLLNDKFSIGEKIITEFSQLNNKIILYKKITSYLHKDITDKELSYFLLSPLPQDKTLICKIIKKSENILGKIYPTYELYLNSNDKLLLTAKKIYKTTATTYLIFKGGDERDIVVDVDFSNSDSDYIGKISSNFLVNEFNIFDHGLKPEDKKKNKLNGDVRVQYGSIRYVRKYFEIFFLNF
jgi:hypothetical protein